MATSSLTLLAVLLLIIIIGIILWRIFKKKLDQEGSVEGVITERGKPPWRQPLDVEEEIEQLKSRLGRK